VTARSNGSGCTNAGPTSRCRRRGRGGLSGRALALVGMEARMHDRNWARILATDQGPSTCVTKLAVPFAVSRTCPCRHKRRLRGRPHHAHSLSHDPR
jgi:hypothetical protein